jgi:hypothetical protein
VTAQRIELSSEGFNLQVDADEDGRITVGDHRWGTGWRLDPGVGFEGRHPPCALSGGSGECSNGSATTTN